MAVLSNIGFEQLWANGEFAQIPLAENVANHYKPLQVSCLAKEKIDGVA